MKPFVILAEEGRGEEIKKLLLSTQPLTGEKVPPFAFETGARDYYFGWDGRRYIADLGRHLTHIPKYQLDGFKFLSQLEEVLK